MTRSFLFFRSAACAVMIAAIVHAAGGCGAPDRGTELVPYMGQSVPGPTPEHFAPGIVDTGTIEINGVFTPDGHTFFFARQIEGVFAIFRSEFGETGWAAPTPMDVYPHGVRALKDTLADDGVRNRLRR